MPVTVTIRDMDDDVYAALLRRAKAAGISVPALLRKEAARLAALPALDPWLARTRLRSSPGTGRETLDALDASRGPWPDVAPQ